MSESIKEYLGPGKKNLILIYILYLGGIILPLLPIIGAVFAFINQNHKIDKTELLKSHYKFAFRTFILGLLMGAFATFIAFITFFTPILLFFMPILYISIFVWFVVRSIVAIKYLLEETPHPNPLTFWIK